MKRGWAASVLMLAGVWGSAAASADPMPIRVGWVVTPGHLAPLIEALGKAQPGVFKHLGQSYVDADDAFPGHDAADPGAGDQRIRHRRALDRGARAGDHQREARRAGRRRCRRGRASRAISARISSCAADGPIKKIEDVKGKRVATNAIGSAQRSPRCGRCSASTASRTATSRRSRPISPTCRRCSTAAKST